jgi:hypothetical protein
MDKTRPLVDPSVFTLAEHWLSSYRIHSVTPEAETAALEDATWALASEIQNAIESWMDYDGPILKLEEE